MRLVLAIGLVATVHPSFVNGFLTYSRGKSSLLQPLKESHRYDQSKHEVFECDETENVDQNNGSRRSFLTNTALTALAVALVPQDAANAAVGTLPEFSDTNAILQGITIRVADQSQQKAMISFLEDAFDMEVKRKRIAGSVEETWMGYGPEELNIPSDFELPVSSFSQYGGHASICIVYDQKESTPLYRIGDDAPGNNIAYVQLGVPGYRISQMVANGGKILDAYGIAEVVSPSGLPIRGIVGIAPDPIMFVAINCADVKKSKAFYEQLGFVEQEYPYARPNKGKGQFEPPQPKNSVYLAPSANCMGVLLLPSKKKVTPNPAVQSLKIVYTPSADDDETSSAAARLIDPSGVGLAFQAVNEFEREEVETR